MSAKFHKNILLPVLTIVWLASPGFAAAASFKNLFKFDNSFIFCGTPEDGKYNCVWDRAGGEVEAVYKDVGKIIGKIWSNEIKATRVFSGPGQYPPESFAAYGILAFRSRASTSHDLKRHQAICKAYVNTLPHKSKSSAKTSDQMVTVWPIETDKVATAINKAPRKSVCNDAIPRYGLTIAQQAIKRAANAGVTFDGIGPFLLAWSPPSAIGKPDAVVLWADLSNITTYARALPIMQMWVNDIEGDPALWQGGWNVEKVRRKFRRWLDDYGPSLASAFGIKE